MPEKIYKKTRAAHHLNNSKGKIMTITIETEKDVEQKVLDAVKAIFKGFDVPCIVKKEVYKTKYTEKEFMDKLEKSSKSGRAYTYTTSEDFFKMVESL